jgi:hypothetical protein
MGSSIIPVQDDGITILLLVGSLLVGSRVLKDLRAATGRTDGNSFADLPDPGTRPARRRFSREAPISGRNAVTDSRDIQHGVNDPVGGLDVKRKIRDNQSPHERAQTAADVRADASPAPDEVFLPEALRRKPTEPLNKRSGRNPVK